MYSYSKIAVFIFNLQDVQDKPGLISLPVNTINSIPKETSDLADSCQKTLIIKTMRDGIVCSVLTKLVTYSNLTTELLKKLTKEPQTYIILLQNSEEIRASGGFMGSYAKLTVGKQGISELSVQDIYEPDGQFTGYVEPPSGVAEYLSSGNGMRLPDANWHPDFPTAAQTILNYFSLGNEKSVDGVIAINSSLVEKVLAITGDIYLPDYQTNVSADTLTTLARADRDAFFPGSKQKQHFLQALLNQLKLRFEELTPSQQQELLAVLQNAVSSKDILVYAPDEEVQYELEKVGLAGQLPPTDTTDLLYFVESNVGINKANRAVSRTIELEFEDYQVTAALSYSNQNPVTPPASSADDNLNYANYLRVITPTTWDVAGIKVNQNLVDDWSERVLSTSNGIYKEIGFLHIVPASETQDVQIVFNTPHGQLDRGYQLNLLKQPGMTATPVLIEHNKQLETVILEADTPISLPLL